MKYYELDPEEKEILEEFEKGNFKRVKNFAQAKKDAIEAARNTLSKAKNINIRLSEKVLLKIKAKAATEGIPYQTLVSSVLHKYANS